VGIADEEAIVKTLEALVVDIVVASIVDPNSKVLLTEVTKLDTDDTAVALNVEENVATGSETVLVADVNPTEMFVPEVTMLVEGGDVLAEKLELVNSETEIELGMRSPS
jgi:hypothetical protein